MGIWLHQLLIIRMGNERLEADKGVLRFKKRKKLRRIMSEKWGRQEELEEVKFVC